MTIRPRARSSMPGITARQQRWTPSTFTSWTRHHSSGSTSQVGPSWLPIPALATSSVSGPSSRSVSATAFSTAPRSVTSSSRARPPISLATSSTCSRVRAATATRAPASASSRAMSAPMPRPPPVTSAISFLNSSPATTRGYVRARAGSGPRRRFDLVERFRVLQGREVAGIVAEGLRAHGAADDLRAASLRERRDEEDPLRCKRLAQVGRDEPPELADELVGGLGPRDEGAEDPGNLALHLVRDAHGRGLGDRRVRDHRGLQLGRADPLPRDVERVVGAAVQEPVAVLVDRRPVAVHPHARQPPPARPQP